MINEVVEKPTVLKIEPQGGQSYPVTIGMGVIWETLERSVVWDEIGAIVVICDSIVRDLYGTGVENFLQRKTGKSYLFSFKSGEENKTRETKTMLENMMLSARCDKDTLVLGFGGGVSTDMAGFVAATYMRGIDCFLIPTSLLAMVDAAVGGKNGVNTPHGKNLIGSFHQPKGVIVDIDFLETLSNVYRQCGFAEMVKHGVIADREYFDFLFNNSDKLAAGDRTVLFHSVVESIRIKAEIVREDTRERGKRKILNFGHTIGHALEKACKWRINHGKAVAFGMMVEAWIAVACGFLDESIVIAIKRCLEAYGLLEHPGDFDKSEFFSSLLMDKKNRGGGVMMSLPKKMGEMHPGDGKYGIIVEKEIITTALDRLCVSL